MATKTQGRGAARLLDDAPWWREGGEAANRFGLLSHLTQNVVVNDLGTGSFRLTVPHIKTVIVSATKENPKSPTAR